MYLILKLQFIGEHNELQKYEKYSMKSSEVVKVCKIMAIYAPKQSSIKMQKRKLKTLKNERFLEELRDDVHNHENMKNLTSITIQSRRN